MRTIGSAPAMQRLALRWRREAVRVGFVPTMGFLHTGHVSLIGRARRAVGSHGRVVVSIYVNPTQFGPGEDLASYPRDRARDLALCRAAGADVVFHPDDAQMYPGRDEAGYSTYVAEEVLSTGMEGVSRPLHFRGVTTIIAKLFNLVQPDVAVFGAKDWQQAAVVRRMTRDLNFPVRIIVAPTVREPDGLAMSSRNRYLNPGERRHASILWRAIQSARAAVRNSHAPMAAARLKNRIAAMIRREPGVRLDYLAFFEPNTLKPARTVTRATHMALAVRLGATRLIDNARL